MGLYDPKTGQWYTEQTAPPGMPLYDTTKGSWFQSTPGVVPQGGTWEGAEGAPPPGPSMTPTSAPAGVTLPKNIGSFVDPSSTSPQDLAAQLLRSEFADWQSFFRPIELKAMENLSFNNPEVLPKAVGEAETAATNQYRTLSGTLQRQNQSKGIAPNQQETATSRRLMDLSQAAATAGAANTARQSVRTQDEQILLGTSPNPNLVKASLGS